MSVVFIAIGITIGIFLMLGKCWSLRRDLDNWRRQALEENAALDVARRDCARLASALRPIIRCKPNDFNKMLKAICDCKRIANGRPKNWKEGEK